MNKARPVIPPFPSEINRDHFARWLAGFTDGEASFTLRTLPDRRKKFAQPFACFRITLRDDDAEILRLIQSFFGCGRFYLHDNHRSKIKNAKPTAIYTVQDSPSLASRIIPHFDTCTLMTKKLRDFLIWREGVLLLQTVKERRWTYRPRRGHQRPQQDEFGAYPKWTLEEREHFDLLVKNLQEQRAYPVVTPRLWT